MHKNKSLQELLPRFPKRVIIRFGSFHEYDDSIERVEINTVNAVDNSSDKFRMKACFNRDGVKTADAFYYLGPNHFVIASDNPEIPKTNTDVNFEEFKPPFVGKVRRGSRGIGMVLIETVEELNEFCNNFDMFKNAIGLEGKTVGIGGFIFEKYRTHSREYRIHISNLGVIYTNRKVIKNDTPDDQRYFRNDSNSNWLLESNSAFDKPSNWDDIIEESKKALNAVGLTVGAVDVKVQSATNKKGEKRENPDFFIVEINSAPSFGEGTLKAYAEMMPRIITSKM